MRILQLQRLRSRDSAVCLCAGKSRRRANEASSPRPCLRCGLVSRLVAHGVAVALTLVTMWFSLSACAMAQLPDARLFSVFPPGGQQGTKVELLLAGVDLDGV